MGERTWGKDTGCWDGSSSNYLRLVPEPVMLPKNRKRSVKNNASKKKSRPIKQRRTIRLENLESRRLLTAVTMSDHEQLLLELINRARSNPTAEAAFFGIGLNDGISGTIDPAAKQPVAPNQILTDVAGAHSQDMIIRDYFAHVNPEGQSPSARVRAAGYPSGAWENISYGGSTGPIDQDANVYDRHRALFLSTTGHRQNILLASHEEIGVGVRFGDFNGFQRRHGDGKV